VSEKADGKSKSLRGNGSLELKNWAPAPVAQWTERRPSKPWVAGSNPAGGIALQSQMRPLRGPFLRQGGNPCGNALGGIGVSSPIAEGTRSAPDNDAKACRPGNSPRLPDRVPRSVRRLPIVFVVAVLGLTGCGVSVDTGGGGETTDGPNSAESEAPTTSAVEVQELSQALLPALGLFLCLFRNQCAS
jgi:hypothetical protein